MYECFSYMYVSVLPALWCPWRLEEGPGFSGSGIMNSILMSAGH